MMFDLLYAVPDSLVLYFSVKCRFAHVQCSHGLGCCDGAASPPGCDLLKFRCLDRLSAGILPLFLGNGDALTLALQNILSL